MPHYMDIPQDPNAMTEVDHQIMLTLSLVIDIVFNEFRDVPNDPVNRKNICRAVRDRCYHLRLAGIPVEIEPVMDETNNTVDTPTLDGAIINATVRIQGLVIDAEYIAEFIEDEDIDFGIIGFDQ